MPDMEELREQLKGIDPEEFRPNMRHPQGGAAEMRSEVEELRKELSELREELRELRRQLRDSRGGRSGSRSGS
jgi:transposase-like protein